MKELTLDRLPLDAPRDANDKTKILYGVQVAMLGPAKGHGVELDETTLDQIVELGNAQKDGVKTRFNHPSMCTPALGTFVGHRENFRREGNYVKADFIASPAAKAEHLLHINQMAKHAPNMLGSSVVVSADHEYRTDERGHRLKDAEGNELPPVLRVEKLHAVDFVDDPASGDGMFGAEPIDGLSFSAKEMVNLRTALKNPEFVKRAQGIVAHQARLLGLSSDVPEAPAPPENTAAQERDRVKYIMKMCNGKAHLQADRKDFPGGLMNFAIDTGMDRLAFLEAVIDLNAKAATLHMFEAESDALEVAHAGIPESDGHASRPRGSLEASMKTKFLKLGYSETQAAQMAKEAAAN